MLLPQQGQQDRGYLDHEQRYAQPSDHLAYRFWVPHKETDVGEEEAHGHVVDAGRKLPAQDARDPRQPYCDEHRRRGPCVVPAQPSVFCPHLPLLCITFPIPALCQVPSLLPTSLYMVLRWQIERFEVQKPTEVRSTAGPTTGSAAKRPAEVWR